MAFLDEPEQGGGNTATLDATLDAPYPVVEATGLDPLPSRFLRRPRRFADELPLLTGGSVLVFQANERYAMAPPGPRMLSSDIVVRATMVAVVLTKSQEVQVVALLSAYAGLRVMLRASYNCQVLDPVRVLESGCWDVSVELRGHLLRDMKLRMLGARTDVAQNPDVHQRILAWIFARNDLEPPFIPGMRVELSI